MTVQVLVAECSSDLRCGSARLSDRVDLIAQRGLGAK
jgi:hypothetical protein